MQKREKRLFFLARTRKSRRLKSITPKITFSFDPKETSATQKQAGLLA